MLQPREYKHKWVFQYNSIWIRNMVISEPRRIYLKYLWDLGYSKATPATSWLCLKDRTYIFYTCTEHTESKFLFAGSAHSSKRWTVNNHCDCGKGNEEPKC